MRKGPSIARVIDAALSGLALVVTVAVTVGALHDVCQAWDSGYYHLPFAARLGGVVPESSFVLTPANRERFAGFPLLGELLQGLLWRVTGHAPATNLVALASVPLFAWFLRRSFAVPLHYGVLGLFAIPLVQTHAASTYVDLPANAALAVVVLLAMRAWTSREAVSGRVLGLAVVAAGVAVNMKTLAGPLAAASLGALAVRAFRVADRSSRRRVALAALALPLAFATPLKNAALHGNPFYPIRTTVLGVALPGVEAPYASSPAWLEHAPQPLRFACSVLEIGVRPLSDPRRWTVDQWAPSGDTSYRMGGFFGAFVVMSLIVLVWRAAKEKGGPARRAALGFGALTAVVSVMPQSHELRYYLVWMLVLVGTNAWLACRPGAPASLLGPRGLGAASAVAMLIVVGVTRFDYVTASGSTFAELRARKTDEAAISRIPDGARVCVQREPWNLLWAAPFHAPKRYVVIEADEPGDCGGAPSL